jgi:DNA ligase-4
MKESRIASLYLKALGASNAETLKFFEDPKKNKEHMGDFTNTVRATIVKSNINTPEFTTLSFEEINDKLNDLANTSTNHEKEEAFRFLISHLSVSEQIWTLKIILKDLDIHMAQGSILPLYHPDAVKYFQVCKNLKKLCEDLHDPLVRIDEFPITLFNPFSPQLCVQADLSLLVEFCTDRFWIETKLDGERMQMHYKNGEYKWWSR